MRMSGRTCAFVVFAVIVGSDLTAHYVGLGSIPGPVFTYVGLINAAVQGDVSSFIDGDVFVGDVVVILRNMRAFVSDVSSFIHADEVQ